MLTQLPEIFTTFQTIPDPRKSGGNKRHNLFEMIVIVLCATIGGAESWADVERFACGKEKWFKKYLNLRYGVPSHDTFGRVFAVLDTAIFNVCLQDWIEHLELDLKGRGVHIDGKTLRRSFNHATDKKALHMVNAWVDGLSICLGQVVTDEKSNEITAVPMLLEMLSIEGAVVTLDAMNCQTKTIAKIRDKKADYLITTKKNQPKLHQQIVDTFADFAEDNFQSRKCRSHQTTHKTRGRIEQRTVIVSAAPRSLKESGRWTDIKTIVMIRRHRMADPNSKSKKPIKESNHVTYYISSLPPKAKLIAKHLNKHWTVENTLHWTLDVTFTEDKSRVRTGNAPELLAIFRRIALSILKRDTSIKKESIRGKRMRAGWSEDALAAIIFGK